MALGQTLALPKTILLLCTPRNPVIPSLSSLNPNPPIHLFSSPPPQTTKNTRRKSTVKCSLDYNNNGHGGGVAVPQYPRPSEIPWQKEICNTVHLIGYVTTVVQIRYLPDNRAVAICRIAVKKSPLDSSSILLAFWNELAHVAFQHLERGTQIYVCGRLIVDVVETDDGKEQTYYKVTVKQLNLVEKFSSSDGNSNSESQVRKPPTTASREELWQAFFANPADWWDNRKRKSDAQRHPRYPDFKHKHTGEALWVEGRFNPPWVKSQLEILDARREAFAFQDQNDGMNGKFGAVNNFSAL